ncbi:hypothetical protein P8452_59147 [Trifolium repens]|nr:hypothetical protein P8452_59147 [Trifolium repens]
MASQSSSSSSTSQHQDANKQNQHPNSNSNNLDFIKLWKDDLVHGSNLKEYNFFGPIQVGSSSSSSCTIIWSINIICSSKKKKKNDEGINESKNQNKNSDSKSYPCSYCPGQYSSLQALGGHQHAHKAERALQMQLINQRPLGVRIESMIQKSPNSISPRIGLGALRLHDILNPSLVSMRNNTEGSTSGVASLGIGGATTSTHIIAPTSTMDGIRKLKSSDFDSSGLDLSLKL